MSEPLADLVVEAEDWDAALPDLAEVAEAGALMALQAAGLDPAHYAVSLLATDDARMQALNGLFRGRETPTNVLSWPAFDLAPDTPGAAPGPPPVPAGDARLLLGDVALGLQTCQREAESAAIPLKNHVTHLILHGCLHLLGYDHETDADADVMEGLERGALGRAGIPDPYS